MSFDDVTNERAPFRISAGAGNHLWGTPSEIQEQWHAETRSDVDNYILNFRLVILSLAKVVKDACDELEQVCARFPLTD